MTNVALTQNCSATPAPPVPVFTPAKAPTTGSPYDVVNKSITQMGADMAAGLTTSVAITRAYLDRIAAYDEGPFGFHSYITVAKDALAQAAAADARRAAGEKGDLLGIPVNVKDLYDTKDMPTTDGSLAFEGWQPKRDAFQVARLRAAGAVILGKGNLSEFANSGSYSESGYGMVWNAFKPSKSSLGSVRRPGGRGRDVAGRLRHGLADRRVVVRALDRRVAGVAARHRRHLLDRGRDAADVAAGLRRPDRADDERCRPHPQRHHRHRPGGRLQHLRQRGRQASRGLEDRARPNALQGKRIGYMTSWFTGSPSYGQDDGTAQAVLARFADLQAAGATMVEMASAAPSGPAGPTLSGNRGEEGWQQYFDRQVDPPFHTAAEILSSPKVLPYNRGTTPARARLTAADNQAIMANRDEYKARIKTWMDTNNVDAVVYPGFRSDVYDNDGAQTLSSDRNSGVLTSGVGLPTLILPVGANPHGDPISIQIMGRAFDDAKMLGFGYALEQQLGGAGHLVPATAPKLPYSVDTPAPPIGGTVPATLSLTLGTPATFGAFTPGVDRTYAASTTASVISTAGDATLSTDRRHAHQRRVRAARSRCRSRSASRRGTDRCPTTP